MATSGLKPRIADVVHWSDGGLCVAAMVVGFSENPDLPDALTLRTFGVRWTRDTSPVTGEPIEPFQAPDDALKADVQREDGAHGGHPGGTWHPADHD